MVDLSPELVTILMFGGLLLLIATGYPLAFILIGLGMGTGLLLYGTAVFELFRLRSYGILASFIFMAVPLFVFMGAMVEKSGVAEKLYSALYVWMAGFRGGLAVASVLLGTILAACVGVIAASVVTIGLLSIPAMLRRGYDKSLAAGAVCAGGSLGILIPPSIMLIIYGPTAGLSVGKLFMAAFPAGLLLSLLYVVYLSIRCFFQPRLAPPLPKEEYSLPMSVKVRMLGTSLLPTVILILSVLGAIYFGVASPTEAAGVGALASTLLAAAYRNLSFHVLQETLLTTLRTTCMVMLIGLGAAAFTSVFSRAGGVDVVTNAILAVPFGRWGSFAIIMAIVFILGMFIDWIGIIFVVVPMVSPMATDLGFDPLWFAMMIILNLQMSFITPPFAYAIFFLKGIASEDWGLETEDIIRGIVPYVGLIIVALLLCIAFPDILLWLPAHMVT